METGSLRLTGAPNFRDLGGRETVDGRRIARRRVFRSGNFSRLTDADFETLRSIPLRTVIDLRAASETRLYPSHWPPSLMPKLVEIGLNPYEHADGASYKKILVDDPSPAGAMATIAMTYRLLPKICGPAVKRVVDHILADAAPLAFNCSNGRDRTGLVAMLLLYMLGVSREDIVADYLESNARIDLDGAVKLSRAVLIPEYGIEFDDETLRTMNQALEQNVHVAFETMTEIYGSVDAYLEAFGIRSTERDALRTTLLENA